MAEGSISTFDFHVQHYGLSGRRVPGEERSSENGSWAEWVITKVNNLTGLPNIFSKIYVEFFVFVVVLTIFFFFLPNTTHPEVSHRENDYVEKISGKNVEWSYVNKVCQFEMTSPGFTHTHWAPKWSPSKQHCLLQTWLQVLGIFVFFFARVSSKPSAGLHFKLDSCNTNGKKQALRHFDRIFFRIKQKICFTEKKKKVGSIVFLMYNLCIG